MSTAHVVFLDEAMRIIRRLAYQQKVVYIQRDALPDDEVGEQKIIVIGETVLANLLLTRSFLYYVLNTEPEDLS